MSKIKIWIMKRQVKYYHKRIITYFKRHGRISCKKVMIWDMNMKHTLRRIQLERGDSLHSDTLI